MCEWVTHDEVIYTYPFRGSFIDIFSGFLEVVPVGDIHGKGWRMKDREEGVKSLPEIFG
jgi:hypothetical protein